MFREWNEVENLNGFAKIAYNCMSTMPEQHNDHAYFPYRRQIIQIDGIDYSCQREHNLNHKSKNVQSRDPFKGKCSVWIILHVCHDVRYKDLTRCNELFLSFKTSSQHFVNNGTLTIMSLCHKVGKGHENTISNRVKYIVLWLDSPAKLSVN